MEALSHYHLEYPNITLVPSVMPAQKIDEALENRVIDFAVSTVSLNASYKKSSKIIRAFLQKYELMLAISSENPVFSKLEPSLPLTPDKMELLRPLPFISQLMGTSKVKFDLDNLAQFGIVPSKLIPLNDLSFIIQSLVYDNSYALMPYSHISDPRIRLLPFSEKCYSLRELLYLAERKLSPADKYFIEVIQEEYQKYPCYYRA